MERKFSRCICLISDSWDSHMVYPCEKQTPQTTELGFQSFPPCYRDKWRLWLVVDLIVLSIEIWTSLKFIFTNLTLGKVTCDEYFILNLGESEEPRNLITLSRKCKKNF